MPETRFWFAASTEEFLPSEMVEQASQIARVVFTNTWAFLAKAGTTIFCLSVLLWALMYYPRLPESRVAATVQHYKALASAPGFPAEHNLGATLHIGVSRTSRTFNRAPSPASSTW